MSSESDDDLLALAGADSETEDEMPSKKQKTGSKSPEPAHASPEGGEGEDDDDDDGDEDMNGNEPDQEDEDEDSEPSSAAERIPYPLEGKFKSEADRDRLMGLPELERESILFDRAEEMRNYKERIYLRQRAQAQANAKEVPAARSTRSGTSSRLQELRKARQARQEQEDDYSESEAESDGSDVSDVSDASGRGAASEASDIEAVEWAEDETSELSAADINAARWGKTQLATYAHYPGFENVIRGCFVRVSVGFNAQLLQNAYICGQVVRTEKCDPYVFGDRRRVDERLVVTYAGSEQGVEMGSCSDGHITDAEFAAWKNEMASKDLSMPSKRRVAQKAEETRAEQSRVLTSEEISAMVERRQALAGPSGSNVVLQRSQLEEQRQAALDAGDDERVAEIDTELEQLQSRRQSRAVATKSALDMLSERNRKSNLHSVRKAEVQAQVERRRSGFALKADPFSRLRTNARLFYTDTTNNNASDAPVAQVEEPEGNSRLTLSGIDSMIGSIDIELRIVI